MTIKSLFHYSLLIQNLHLENHQQPLALTGQDPQHISNENPSIKIRLDKFYISNMSKTSFNPVKDISDLSNRVFLVTGGKFPTLGTLSASIADFGNRYCRSWVSNTCFCPASACLLRCPPPIFPRGLSEAARFAGCPTILITDANS